MSDYKLVMFLSKNGKDGKASEDAQLGHMAARLIGPNGEVRQVAFGFGGLRGSGGDTIRKEDQKMMDNSGLSFPSEPISLTKEQYEKFQAYVDEAQKNPPSYFLIGRNCVDFVRNGLEAADKKVDDLPMLFSPKALREGGAAANYLVVRSAKDPDDHARYFEEQTRETYLKDPDQYENDRAQQKPFSATSTDLGKNSLTGENLWVV